MTLVDSDEVAAVPALMWTPPVEPAAAIRVSGKFFFAGAAQAFRQGRHLRHRSASAATARRFPSRRSSTAISR